MVVLVAFLHYQMVVEQKVEQELRQMVMLFLERIGVVDVASYTSQWRLAVLVICIVSAILTPADPYSMVFLAVPLCLLYFGGVGLCLWAGSRTTGQATNASQ